MIAPLLYKKLSKPTHFPHPSLPHTHQLIHHLLLSSKSQPGKLSSSSNGGQGGGRAAGREPLRGAAAHRHRGAGRRRGREGLQGTPAGAAVRGGGAHLVVLLPGGDRRVPGHLPLPLHLGADGDGRGGRPVGVQVRHGGHPGHRVELRRHDLRAGVLHRGDLRRAHQPGGDVRAVPGQEAVAHQGRVLHRDAVPGGHMRRRGCEGVPDHAIPGQRRRRQLRGARVHQGGRARGGDRGHLRAGLHRLLRHRRQAQRQRLPRPHFGAASDRVRGVPGAPGDHPHHGDGHQPGEVAGRRHHLQQEAGVGRPLDLLGWAVHRRGAGGHLPRGGDQGHPLQEPRLDQSTSLPTDRPWKMESYRCSSSIDPSIMYVCGGGCSCERTWIISRPRTLASCNSSLSPVASSCSSIGVRGVCLSALVHSASELSVYSLYFPYYLLYCTVLMHEIN